MSKMTDEQIKKALECCTVGYCQASECPARGKGCRTGLIKSSLDLINRQQSAIDVYMRENDRLKTAYIQVSMDRDEAKAEIERLQKDSKRLKKVQMQLDDALKMYSTIKTEVIKEFAERLDRKFAFTSDTQCISAKTIRKLIQDELKEMVGEGK